jgi:hypothetical protein
LAEHRQLLLRAIVRLLRETASIERPTEPPPNWLFVEPVTTSAQGDNKNRITVRLMTHGGSKDGTPDLSADKTHRMEEALVQLDVLGIDAWALAHAMLNRLGHPELVDLAASLGFCVEQDSALVDTTTQIGATAAVSGVCSLLVRTQTACSRVIVEAETVEWVVELDDDDLENPSYTQAGTV